MADESGGVARNDLLQLSHLLPALWKQLVRATRASEDLPTLESQVSILRALVDGGATSPARLADELHLARPTISNLLRGLEADGLVVRAPSAADGRSVVVTPTHRAREVLDRFRRGRLEVLLGALEDLPQADRTRVVEALPSLERLLSGLEAVADAVPVTERRPA